MNNSDNIIFVTGGCGFIGSNFINYIMKKYDKIKLINNSDLDYLDMLYREKLRYGTKNEIIIKLK